MPRTGLIVFALLVLGVEPVPAADQSRPNVIFILIDDMGWRDLGCYGSDFFKTPNIDKFATQGMRFTNAYAACPVCSPTRASILTGKYPARLHLTDFLPGGTYRPSQKLRRPKFQQFLPVTEVSLATALKPAGYVSARIGKWHLGPEPRHAGEHGFDVHVGGLTARKDQGSVTDRLTEEAIKFIAKNKDKLFFLYLAHYAVHIPLQAKKEIIAKYEGKQGNPIYAAVVESVDDSVGQIMKKLDEVGIADNTIIIFTSDNGGLSVREGPDTPSTSNAPLRDGKGYLYEGGIREPLIVKWPGVTKPGSTCDATVSSVDFFPTILEMAQIEKKRMVDGISFAPILKGADVLRRDAIYWHYPHYSNQGGKPSGAVRQGNFKLIEFYEDGKLELYNLHEDIGETTDLAFENAGKNKRNARLAQGVAEGGGCTNADAEPGLPAVRNERGKSRAERPVGFAVP